MVQFAGTFTVWIVAEHIGLSGILTIVAYAVTIARTAPANTPARLRVPAYAVWDTAVFVLNVLAFMLIGMQLRPIWARLGGEVRLEYCVVAACVLATVILTRIVWVAIYRKHVHHCAMKNYQLDRSTRMMGTTSTPRSRATWTSRSRTSGGLRVDEATTKRPSRN